MATPQTQNSNKPNRGDVKKFQKIVNENYLATKNYYTKRINLMLMANNAIENNEANIQAIREDISDYIFNKLSEDFNNRQNEILNPPNGKTVYYTKNSDNQKIFRNITLEEINKIAEEMGLSDLGSVQKGFNLALSNKKPNKKGNIDLQASQVMGQIKEYFIDDVLNFFIAKAQKTIEEKNDSLVYSAISSFLTGAQAVGQVKYYSPFEAVGRKQGKDLGVDFGKGILDSNGRAETWLEIPINYKVDIFYNKPKKQKQSRDGYWDYLNTNYIDSNRFNGWGFQSKNFSYNQSSFTQRSLANFKERLNEYQQKGEYLNLPQRKTWNSTQALYFMLAKISDNLVSILGPTTLGVIFSDGFFWMDDFVNSYLFRQSFSSNSPSDEDNIERWSVNYDNPEVFPHISSSDLKAFRYNYQDKFVFQRKTFKNATKEINEPHFDIKFDVYKKDEK